MSFLKNENYIGETQLIDIFPVKKVYVKVAEIVPVSE